MAVVMFGSIVIFVFVESWLRPQLIPRAEIEALAEAAIRDRPGDPEGWAYGEEVAAWYRSDSLERGKWLRVRKAIRRRLQA